MNSVKVPHLAQRYQTFVNISPSGIAVALNQRCLENRPTLPLCLLLPILEPMQGISSMLIKANLTFALYWTRCTAKNFSAYTIHPNESSPSNTGIFTLICPIMA